MDEGGPEALFSGRRYLIADFLAVESLEGGDGSAQVARQERNDDEYVVPIGQRQPPLALAAYLVRGLQLC